MSLLIFATTVFCFERVAVSVSANDSVCRVFCGCISARSFVSCFVYDMTCVYRCRSCGGYTMYGAYQPFVSDSGDCVRPPFCSLPFANVLRGVCWSLVSDILLALDTLGDMPYVRGTRRLGVAGGAVTVVCLGHRRYPYGCALTDGRCDLRQDQPSRDRG